MTKGRAYVNRPADPRNDWETPTDVFDRLDAKYGPFDMDAFAAVGQYSATKILDRRGRICIEPPTGSLKGSTDRQNPSIFHDAFEHPWIGKIFMNSPYGPPQLLYACIEKAVREVQFHNAELVCSLLPSRTGSRWWKDYVVKEIRLGKYARRRRGDGCPFTADIEFLRGRLTFGGAKWSAPFPSVVVVWRPE